MSTTFDLDRCLLEAVQVSGDDRTQLAALVAAARQGEADDRAKALVPHLLLAAALGLAYRPVGMSPEEAIGTANRTLLALLMDPGCPEVSTALPAAVLTAFAIAEA